MNLNFPLGSKKVDLNFNFNIYLIEYPTPAMPNPWVATQIWVAASFEEGNL